jgi:hypothetical protein
MAKFIATIELQEANEASYKTLQSELAKKSFTGINSFNFKKSDKITVLPKLEFQREGNVTIQEVTDAVMRAASKTGKKYSFTIIRNKPVYNNN